MKTTMNIIEKALFCLFSFVAVTACNEKPKFDQEEQLPPIIRSFSPTSGKAGTEVTIAGDNLQRISEVLIGGGKATLKYRIDPTTVVVVVNNVCRTGAVEVIDEAGTSKSTDLFTVAYAVPALTKVPAGAAVNAQVVIEGANLEVVSKILFGTTEGAIIHKSDKELVVSIPFTTESQVKISLSYFDGTAFKLIESTSLFSVEKPAPQITSCPDSGEANTPIELLGENLAVIDEVVFGSIPVTIVDKSETRLTIQLPAIDETTTESLIIKYYGTEKTIKTNFEIVVVAQPKVLYWENVNLTCESAQEVKAFFNTTTGEVYSPCDLGDIKANTSVYFYTVFSGERIVIGNPNQASGKVGNFKCSGTALVKENFINNVRFRTLATTNVNEKRYINLVKSKQIEEVSYEKLVEEAALVALPSSNVLNYNAAKVAGEGGSNEYVAGDVIVFTLLDAAGTKAIKVGFIEIVTVTDLGKASSLVVNCYWQNN